MSPIALGQFIAPPSGLKAGQFDPAQNVGKPVIMVPREHRTDFVTPRFPNPKDVVIYDLVDLTSLDPATGEARNLQISVITGAGAMVDRLKNHLPGQPGNDTGAPMALPVKIVAVERPGKATYFSIAGLEGQELQLAQLWDTRFGIAYIDAKRAEVQAEQQVANGAAAGNGMPAWAANGAAPAPAPAAAPAAAPVTEAATAPPAANTYAGSSEQDLAAAIAALQK